MMQIQALLPKNLCTSVLKVFTVSLCTYCWFMCQISTVLHSGSHDEAPVLYNALLIQFKSCATSQWNQMPYCLQDTDTHSLFQYWIFMYLQDTDTQASSCTLMPSVGNLYGQLLIFFLMSLFTFKSTSAYLCCCTCSNDQAEKHWRSSLLLYWTYTAKNTHNIASVILRLSLMGKACMGMSLKHCWAITCEYILL